MEIVQTMNSDPGLAVGEQRMSLSLLIILYDLMILYLLVSAVHIFHG